MNVWFLPTANPILNTFLRSIVLILFMVFGLNASWYSAYWGAIIHDTISLILIRPYIISN
jgi:hypothetical protein